MPSKDGTMDDKKKTTKDVVNKKQKQMMNQEEYLPEEEYDHYRDRILMRGGDHRSKETRERSYSRSDDDKRKGDTPVQKEFKKKYGKKATALDAVKKDIEDKYGKDAIMKPKKKDTKEELDLTQVAEAFGGYVIETKRGRKPKDYLTGRISLTGDIPPEERGVQPDAQKIANKRVKSAEKSGKIDDFTNKPIKDAPDTKTLVRGKEGETIANPVTTSKKTAEKTARVSTAGTGGKQVKNQTKFSTETELEDSIRGKSRTPVTTTGQREVIGTTKTGRPKTVKQKPSAPRPPQSQPTFQGFRDKAKVTTSGGVEAPKVMGDKITGDVPKSTRRPKTGFGRSYPGDKKYRTLQDAIPTQKAAKIASKKASRKKVLRKLISSPAVRGRIAGKIAGKVGGKFLAKRIPGVGAVISGAEALSKAAAGDFVGAGIAGAETVAGLIPGIGSVAGAGIGLVGAARDAKRATKSAKTLRSVLRGTQKLKTAKQLKTFKPASRSMVAMKKYAFSPAEKGSMMTGKTKLGRAGRTVAVSGGMDQMRRLNIRRPKIDTGVVGKRTAG